MGSVVRAPAVRPPGRAPVRALGYIRLHERGRDRIWLGLAYRAGCSGFGLDNSFIGIGRLGRSDGFSSWSSLFTLLCRARARCFFVPESLEMGGL